MNKSKFAFTAFLIASTALVPVWAVAKEDPFAAERELTAEERAQIQGEGLYSWAKQSWQVSQDVGLAIGELVCTQQYGAGACPTPQYNHWVNRSVHN